ncbi:MAG: TRAP transporter large permease subunit [Desulfohalobiaceae bacterium]|nr:TRAP transporter large permease subunit [Desulfohalobiaceae bacterium]MCF8085471.1 TRAP transporter large permease subunit [Desulfohalobiaceae bacterium]
MSPELMTAAMFITLILLLCLGHPLAFTLAGVATLYGLIDNGFNIPGLMGMFSNNIWGLMENYVLVAIPLFILMAQLLDRSQVAEKLFDVLYLVLGQLKGGLGLAVVVVSTVFAATTGIIGASVVTMGLLAGPPLLNKGYQKEMASGIICASGTLGILIPPSIMLVVYGGLTGSQATSVGKLFAGAILPGIVLAGLYFIYIFTRCTINPSLGPSISKEEAAKWSFSRKLGLTMLYMLPPLGLIFMVIGTILIGVATPTEAAGMGALGALILALANRAVTWDVIKQSSVKTIRITCMVMLLFVGGKMFSTVFMSMGGGEVINDMLVGSGINRWMALAFMMLIMFIMGMFIDWTAILLVTVPIFMPVAMELGFNQLWFAMLMCVMLQTSFLTPPFGYALFYFFGVAPKDFTMLHIYKGVVPFLGLQLLGILILILFPSLVTWLPSLAFG